MPQSARLNFTYQGSSDFALSDRSVSITADSERYTWNDVSSWSRVQDAAPSSGIVASVSLSLSELKQIAQATSVRGQLGSNTLNLDGGVQSRIEEFVRKMEDPFSSSDSANASSS
jgi:hypothetical protein